MNIAMTSHALLENIAEGISSFYYGEKLMKLTNPYVAGNPVGGSNAFIGRADVLREVLRTLRHPRENALLLYGQRRIGKTSVLQELKKRLPSEGAYLPVYFDLQDKARLPVNHLLKDLARSISKELNIDVPELERENAEETFQTIFLPQVMEKFSSESKIVLLLDEFDVLDNPDSGKAGEEFFPYLRNLLRDTSHQLQFIFVIGRRPDDLTNITNSVFKGTRSHSVSLLSEEDTGMLVRLSEHNESLHWEHDTILQIHTLTGGHPLLTQQLCQEIWEEYYPEIESGEGPPTASKEQVHSAVSATLSAARQALEWLWDGLEPAERVVAAALAEAGAGAITQDKMERLLQESGVRILFGELRNAPRVLQDWDLISKGEDGFRFRVEILRRWIVERKPLSRVQEEIDKIQPMAEGLFSAAHGAFKENNFEQAVDWLKSAIGLNPNHLKANQLLGEIFLAQGELEEARRILEDLYEYYPVAAKPRLTQVLLLQASDEQSDDERLKLFEKILSIDPNHIETRSKYEQVWVQSAKQALSEYAEGNSFPSKSLLPKKIEKILDMLERMTINNEAQDIQKQLKAAYIDYKIKELAELDSQHRYQEALEVAEYLHESRLVEHVPLLDIEILRRKAVLPTLYERAMQSIGKKDHPTAQKALIDIINTEPQYKDVIRHLYIIVKGTDPATLENELKAQNEKLKAKDEKLKAQDEKLKVQSERLEAQDKKFEYGLQEMEEKRREYSDSY